MIEKILRHCGLWCPSSPRAPPAGDLRVHAPDGNWESDSGSQESRELTFVDEATLWATFLHQAFPAILTSVVRNQVSYHFKCPITISYRSFYCENLPVALRLLLVQPRWQRIRLRPDCHGRFPGLDWFQLHSSFTTCTRITPVRSSL